MEIRELNEGEYPLWDRLVEESPQGTIFHNCFWLGSASKLSNRDLRIYGCFKGESLIGGCSLYISRNKFINFASSTVDITPYGGLVLGKSPFYKTREQEILHNDAIYSILKALDISGLPYIKLTNSPGLIDIRPFSWCGWECKVLYTYCFDLNDDIDTKISRKTRNIIRKALKSGITIKKSNDINAFYNMLTMTFKRQGLMPPITRSFMEEMIKQIYAKCAGDMWIAETDSGVPAAAEIFIWDHKRAYRWSAASDPSGRDSGATSLLLHEIFGYLKDNGFKEVNLMAANTPNLAKFVSSFNPRLVPYYSVEKKSILGKIGEMCYRWSRKHRR